MATQTNKEKFKVIPNLSLRGEEILRRVKNGSIKLNPNSGQYSTNPEYSEASKLSKLEIADKIREQHKKANELKSKLNKQQ